MNFWYEWAYFWAFVVAATVTLGGIAALAVMQVLDCSRDALRRWLGVE